MATDATGLIEQVTRASVELMKACERIEPRLFHEERDKAATVRFKKAGFDADGPFRYAPMKDRAEALGKFRAEVDRELAVELGQAEDMIDTLGRLLPPVEAGLAEPPDALAAYRAEHKLSAVDRAQALQVEILDELRRARLTPQVQAMSGAQVLAAYEAAVREPERSEAACLIRLIEEIRASNRLAAPKTPEDARALTALSKRIAEVRESRVPEALKVWRETVRRVRKTLRLAEAGSIKPIRPKV
jgi:hypothetical protein